MNKNSSQKLIFTPNYDKSYFSQVLRPNVKESLEKNSLSYFSHMWGITIDDFTSNENLNENFSIIAYYEKDGHKIVSAIQHRTMPIFGVQFHPEKILFEHKLRVGVHLTRESSMASQELSRILFDFALENHNHFKSGKHLELMEMKSFNSHKTNSVFESVYIFKTGYFNKKNLRNSPLLKKLN